MQSDIVVHQTRIACGTEFIVGCGVVHYTFRICPISLAAIAIDSCPIWLDATSYEILYPCLGLLPTFPYTHTYPSAKPLVNGCQHLEFCFQFEQALGMDTQPSPLSSLVEGVTEILHPTDIADFRLVEVYFQVELLFDELGQAFAYALRTPLAFAED